MSGGGGDGGDGVTAWCGETAVKPETTVQDAISICKLVSFFFFYMLEQFAAIL